MTPKTKPEEQKHPYPVGKSVFVRTATSYFTGKLLAVYDQEILLGAPVAWIADTGRFADSLRTGEFSEVEPMLGNVVIGRGAIVDVSEWKHALPTTQK